MIRRISATLFEAAFILSKYDFVFSLMMSERCFAAAGRAVEDYGCDLVGFDEPAQKFIGPENLILSDEAVKGARPHPDGKRLVFVARCASR